ncbi:MAG: DUF3155 domain-containing protein [bacterium]
MRPKPTKLSKIQLTGREVLKRIPCHRFDNYKSGDLPVTAARKYVRQNGITGPAIIEAVRNKFTTDRFYWCEKGMFSAAFAESNYVNFIELKKIAIQLAEEGFIANQQELYWGMETREPNYEFMYA